MKKRVTAIITILILVCAIAGVTYAYFTAIIANGDKGSSITMTLGTVKLTYSDNEYINADGLLPGDSVSKTLTVTNTGNLATNYDLVWLNLINTFSTKSDLVMNITCSSNIGTCDGMAETIVQDSGNNINLIYNAAIDVNEVHTYIIAILFKETGSDQNDNQGKIISGKIGIDGAEEYKSLELYGYIYDENSNVIPNAVVELHSDPVSVVTDTNGYYKFENVSIGNHTIYVKTSDKTSTIMTSDLSIKYDKTTAINGTDATITTSRGTLGVNIKKTIGSPSLSLVSKTAGTLKGTGGERYYSGEYYAYKANITSIIFDDEINVPIGAVTSWDVSVDQNSTVMAYLDGSLAKGYQLHIQSEYKVFTPANSLSLFANFTKLKSIIGLNNFDTSNATNMSYMFADCSQLISLDLSSFNTSNVTNMTYMFNNCDTLTDLDLSSFNTSSVINMSNMFEYCDILSNINSSSFNTSSVINMSNMFHNCSKLTSLDLSSFNTSNVTDMSYMFSGCGDITSLDLSSFNTSSLTDMSRMFENCYDVTNIDLSSATLSSLIDIRKAFSSCGSLSTVDLRNASFTTVTSYYEWGDIFAYSNSGITVYVKDSTAQSFMQERINSSGISGTAVIAS